MAYLAGSGYQPVRTEYLAFAFRLFVALLDAKIGLQASTGTPLEDT